MNAEDIVAERIFELAAGDLARLLIFRPVDDGNAFMCRGRIVIGDTQHEFRSFGVDSMQALLLALIQADWAMETHGLRRLGATWIGQKREGDWGLLKTDFDLSNDDAVHLVH
jgi:hypothetical protein